MPQSLKSLTLFEDFREELMNRMGEWSEHLGDVDRFRRADPDVGKALAKRSLELERVAVSFVADAKDFFKECASRPEWTWTKLESLSLTSRLLGFAGHSGTLPGRVTTPLQKEKYDKMNTMLLEASAVVKRMPRLKLLEIWDSRRWRTNLFRYELDSGTATVTWKCAPQAELHGEVVEAWEAVARDMGSREFTVVSETLSRDPLWSHGHAIRHLGFRIPVLDPGSEAQIEREHFGLE